QRIRESANPSTSAACTAANEIIMNTSLNRIEVCTVPGGAGSATWIVPPASNTDLLDNVDSTQFLRSDTSDNFTSGTLTLDNGTTLTTNGTLDVNGDATIGDGGDDIAIDTNDWDISSGGIASGFTGITSSGEVNFSTTNMLRIRESANPTTSAACTATNEIIMNTSSNRIEVCTAAGSAGSATWVVPPAGNSDTLDNLDSAQFLRSDSSDSFTSGTLTLDNGTTIAIAGTANIGDGGDDVFINSNDWDISSAGVASGFPGSTSSGTVNFPSGMSSSGGVINFNANSNFAVYIATGTSIGAVSIGGGSNTVAINSSSWDVSTAGAASGFTTFSASGNITTTGGDVIIGSTGLSETTSATDSGAFKIGVFDEFTNS